MATSWTANRAGRPDASRKQPLTEVVAAETARSPDPGDFLRDFLTDLALEKMIEFLAEDSVTTTLLAVDDSKTMRKVLEITFAGEDYNTVVASSPAEAMQHVAQQKPALALVDHKLADASGYDLCQQIKAAAPSTRVIILSSKQTPYDKSKGTAVGADDFMDKPFDSQKMIDKVKAVLSQPATAAAPAAQPAAPQRPAPAHRPAAPAPARPRPAIGGPPAATPRPAGGMAPRVGSTSPRPGISPARPAPNPAPAAVRPAPSPPAAPAAPAAPARPAAATTAAKAATAATASNGDLAGKLQGLGLDAQQVQAVLSLSREVVEQVVWEVVPVLAEALIKEEIQRLTSE